MARIWTAEFEAAHQWAEAWAPHVGAIAADTVGAESTVTSRTRSLIIATVIALGRQGRLSDDAHRRWADHLGAAAASDGDANGWTKDLIEIVNAIGGDG